MAIIKEINSTDFCANINGVNPIVKANIFDVNSIENNCGCSFCTTKLSLSYSASDCIYACNGSCDTYYTNGDCLVCPLLIGDEIYTDTICTLAPTGYYSPDKCIADCDYCYTVVNGIITNIDSCTPQLSCQAVDLYWGADDAPCESGTNCGSIDCDVCKFTNHLFAYTNNGNPSQLSVGDKLFKFNNCYCDGTLGTTNNLPGGVYRYNYNGNPSQPRCVDVDGKCTIVSINGCGILPS